MNLGQDSSKENPIIPAITCAALGKLISQSLSALTPGAAAGRGGE